jgi:hypothetical protein
MLFAKLSHNSSQNSKLSESLTFSSPKLPFPTQSWSVKPRCAKETGPPSLSSKD